MSVLDDIRGGLQTKQGKTFALLAAGGLAWLWWSRRQAGGGAVDPGEVTTTDRVPPAGGGGGGGQTGTTSDRPTDNEQWLQRAVSVLSGPPYNNDPGTVYDALRRALDGLSITSAQQAIVSKAIGLIGSPPGGMPPLNSTQPETPKPKTPTGPHTTVIKPGDSLASLATVYWGNPGWAYKIYNANVSTIENAARRAGYASSQDGYILIAGTVLDIPPVTD